MRHSCFIGAVTIAKKVFELQQFKFCLTYNIGSRRQCKYQRLSQACLRERFGDRNHHPNMAATVGHKKNFFHEGDSLVQVRILCKVRSQAKSEAEITQKKST